MPSSQSTDLLRGLGLSRNPFTDRTAEKTHLDTTALYTHSDLQGFQPSGAQEHNAFGACLSMHAQVRRRLAKRGHALSRGIRCGADQTYLLFGRRGSGKTTVRMQVSG
jgi:hypothetical protein